MSSETYDQGVDDNVESFLFGGAKAFPWAEVGASVEGEIVAAKVAQQRDLDTGALMSWPDGSPRNQLVITLQTALREGDNDDGMRMIYAKGGKHDIAKGEGQSMRDAIAQAVRTAKQTRLEVGGTLVVAYTGVAPAKRGMNPAKLYTAGYRPPKQGISATALFSDERQSGEPF